MKFFLLDNLRLRKDSEVVTLLKDTLEALRVQNGFTQAQLAIKLDVPKSSIDMYENGRQEPDTRTLVRMANLFGVDMNTLFGCKPMSLGDRIKLRRKELGISQESLGKMLGYTSKGSMSQIESNKFEPSVSKLLTLAKALQTTPSYLVGWNDPKERIN